MSRTEADPWQQQYERQRAIEEERQKAGRTIPALTPAEEAKYALDHETSRSDLSLGAQIEYDWLVAHGYTPLVDEHPLAEEEQGFRHEVKRYAVWLLVAIIVATVIYVGVVTNKYVCPQICNGP